MTTPSDSSPRWMWAVFSAIVISLLYSSYIFIDVGQKKREADRCARLEQELVDLRRSVSVLGVPLSPEQRQRAETAFLAHASAIRPLADQFGVGRTLGQVSLAVRRIGALDAQRAKFEPGGPDARLLEARMRTETGRSEGELEAAERIVNRRLINLAEDRDRKANQVFAIACLSWFLGLFLALVAHLYRRDIQRRRRVEETLRAQEERYAHVYNRSPLAFVLWDRAGQIIDWNRRAEELFGWTKEEVVGRDVLELLVPDVARPHAQNLVAQPAGGSAAVAEDVVNRTKAGAERVCEWHAAPVHDERGRVAGTIAVALDVTERRRAERDARASHALVESIRRALSEFIAEGSATRVFDGLLTSLLSLTSSEYGFIAEAVLDADGSRALRARAITHVAWDEPTRATYASYVERGLELRNLDTLFGEALATGEPVIANNPTNDPRRSSLPEGHPPLRAFLGLPFYHGEEFLGVVGIANRPAGYDDAMIEYVQPFLTTCATIVNAHRAERHRRRIEADLQAAKDAAEAANRAKDQFLAVLSHELRNPLTPVLAAATAWLDDPETTEEQRELLEMIRRNVTLEARLIDDLLDVSRIGRGELELHPDRVDAHELVHQAIETCAGAFDEGGLELRLELRAQEHHVEVDPARLQQAFWNLLRNAVKFTPHGGKVTVRSRNEDGRFVVDVIDTGIGIHSDDLMRIFEPFEQGGPDVRRRYGGMGLGLAISRSVIEAQGGRLTVHSEGKGRGAAFTISLPVAAPLPSGAALPEPEDHAFEPLRILLVEDNADTLEYLSRILERQGHDVTPTDSIASASAALDEHDFELIISDIELPDGNGLVLLRRHATDRPIPAIALSGFGSHDDIELSRDAGFVDHLIKPVDARALEAAIRRVASSSSRGAAAG